MLRRVLQPVLAATAATSAAALAMASSASTSASYCNAKKPDAGWKSPPPTIGEAEPDTVVREAMKRLVLEAAAQDGPLPTSSKEPKKKTNTDPAWSYTNVGEGEADIVVREAMQRMAEEAARDMVIEAQREAEQQIADDSAAAAGSGPESGGRLQRHTTKEQVSQRLNLTFRIQRLRRASEGRAV